jgi:hypothetical protein
MSLIKALGIDLAKLVFSIHGVDTKNKCKLRKTIKRNKLLAEVTKLPPCIIAMEACSGAHYWAREFTKLGHDVRFMASKLVIPYRKNEKMTPVIRMQSVKLPQDKRPVLSVSKVMSSKRCCVCIASGKAQSKAERHGLIGCVACYLNLVLSCLKVATHYKRQ